MLTPDAIRQELFMVGKELSKAADAIYQYEVDAEKDDLSVQLEFDKEFLLAAGSVEDRKAHARAVSAESKAAAIVSRAVYNRARMKAKHLELEQMRLMAVLKSIQGEGA